MVVNLTSNKKEKPGHREYVEMLTDPERIKSLDYKQDEISMVRDELAILRKELYREIGNLRERIL